MSPSRPRRRPGENRNHLVEAGLLEFGLYGFHGASTASIARRAAVPQPHVYANFDTKQTLFLACCDRAIDTLMGETDDVSGAQRFLMQMIAVCHSPELGAEVIHRVETLCQALGPDRFHEAVLAGAALLLGSP